MKITLLFMMCLLVASAHSTASLQAQTFDSSNTIFLTKEDVKKIGWKMETVSPAPGVTFSDEENTRLSIKGEVVTKSEFTVTSYFIYFPPMVVDTGRRTEKDYQKTSVSDSSAVIAQIGETRVLSNDYRKINTRKSLIWFYLPMIAIFIIAIYTRNTLGKAICLLLLPGIIMVCGGFGLIGTIATIFFTFLVFSVFAAASAGKTMWFYLAFTLVCLLPMCSFVGYVTKEDWASLGVYMMYYTISLIVGTVISVFREKYNQSVFNNSPEKERIDSAAE